MTDKITIERETLLPCPFCGGAPSEPKEEGGSNEQSGYNFTIRIACTGCAASIQRGSVHDKNGWCNDTGQALASAIAAWNLRAALAQKAEPQEPDMRHPKIQKLIGQNARQQIWMMLVEQLVEDPHFDPTAMNMEHWATLHDNLKEKLTAPPAPAAVPPDGMDTVAIKYAHKMALDLECILAEYGGSWYNTAMQTLGEYRSEMNAIHERECPTFMGEPVIAAAGDKP